jgi:hypothetical protein
MCFHDVNNRSISLVDSVQPPLRYLATRRRPMVAFMPDEEVSVVAARENEFVLRPQKVHCMDADQYLL